MTVPVKVEGFREMEAALAEFTRGTGKNVLKRAALKAIQPMADDMAGRAPIQKGGDRDLQKSIQATDKLNKRQRKLNRQPSTVEVYAGPTADAGDLAPPPQGIQQEFGNENHGPQPFVRPTWDLGHGALLDRSAEELGAEIEKSRQRAARKALKARK